jgi:hypothetical protein
VLTRGMNIRREYGHQEHCQTNAGYSCSAWYKDTDCPQYFQHSRHRHQQLGLWKSRRYHADQIRASLAPMGRCSKKEHDSQRRAKYKTEILEGHHSRPAGKPEGHNQSDKDNQGSQDFSSFVLPTSFHVPPNTPSSVTGRTYMRQGCVMRYSAKSIIGTIFACGSCHNLYQPVFRALASKGGAGYKPPTASNPGVWVFLH